MSFLYFVVSSWNAPIINEAMLDVGKIQTFHTWFVLLAVYRGLMSISRIFAWMNCLLNECGCTTFSVKLSLQVWKNIFCIIRHRHRLRQIVENIKWQKLKCQRMSYNEYMYEKSYICLVFMKHFLTAIHNIAHQWWWTQCSHTISFIQNHVKRPAVVIIHLL